MESLKLTDDAIAHIAKLIQVAILTGTDIVDNLRAVSFVSDESGQLMISPDSSESFESNINNLLNDASNTPVKQQESNIFHLPGATLKLEKE